MRPMLLDGGVGSELQKRGAVAIGDPLWSARALASEAGRRCLRAVHADHLKAGAGLVKTASYQMSVDTLRRHLPHLDRDQCLDLMRDTVRVARAACDDYRQWATDQKEKEVRAVQVAGSVGPYGACLVERPPAEYHGNYVDGAVTIDELTAWHRPRVAALIDAGVDFLALETVPALAEARALLRLLHSTAPRQPAWLAFTCKDGRHTGHGEPLADAVASVWQERPAGLAAAGINCTHPQWIAPLLQSLHDAGLASVPLVVYANSGQDWDAGSDGYVGEKWPIDQMVSTWMRIHPNLMAVGGCCGYRPEDISQLAATLNHLER